MTVNGYPGCVVECHARIPAHAYPLPLAILPTFLEEERLSGKIASTLSWLGKADAVGGGRGVAAPAATKRADRCKRTAFNVGRTTHREGEELHVDGSWELGGWVCI